MADLLFNNFISGEVTPKLAGRDDKSVYFTGVSSFVNAMPLLQGGFTVRPNTLNVGLATGIRLIPFILDSSTSYQIELGNAFMRIWKNGVLQELEVEGVPTTVFDSPFLTAEINEVQFAQDFQSLFLVHKNHPPKQITFSINSFTFSDFVPTLQTDVNYPDTDTEGFCTGTDCPGVVTYFMQRLWFFSSYKHPYGIWASRPFEPTNFEMYDVVETTDEISTAEQIIAAIEADETVADTEVVKTYEKTYRADNAMYLEVGSNRNDAIMWAGSSAGNLLIGTRSSEYAIPASINAVSLYIQSLSFYGAEEAQAMSCNSDVLYLGKGGRKVYAFINAESQEPLNLNFSADHILKAGLLQWAWQSSLEPRLYCVLKDGTMSVLSYNRKYNLIAWSRWNFGVNGADKVLSVCVTDSDEGQNVWLIVERSGVKYIEKFNEPDILDSSDYEYKDRSNTDSPIPIQMTVVSNPYETASTANSSHGKIKMISKVHFKMLNSKGAKFSYNNHRVSNIKPEGTTVQTSEENISGGYEENLQYKIENIAGQALTVLSVTLKMEVS